VRRSSTIGGSQVLDCDVSRQQVRAVDVAGIPSLTTERIMTWRRADKEVPIFIQFNGYPPHVDKMYQVSAARPLAFAFGEKRSRREPGNQWLKWYALAGGVLSAKARSPKS